MAQARIDAEAQVGRADDLADQELQGLGQALAAVFGIAGEAGPAALPESPISLLEAVRRAHHAVFEAAPGRVARLVERQQFVLAKLGGFLEHGIDQIDGRFLTTRQRGNPAAVVVQVAQDETQVVERCAVGNHRARFLGFSVPRPVNS